MFGTILSYISLRLLGVPVDDPACARGLTFVREHGGGSMAPSWAKFWMAVLGVYEWEVRGTEPALVAAATERFCAVGVSCVCVYIFFVGSFSLTGQRDMTSSSARVR